MNGYDSLVTAHGVGTRGVGYARANLPSIADGALGGLAAQAGGSGDGAVAGTPIGESRR